jgi:primosomal protein N' (replication factor Y)
MKKIFQVILPLNIEKIFSYKGDNANIGDLVLVPFAKKKLLGIIWEEEQIIDFATDKLKEIEEIITTNLYSKEYLEFCKYFVNYNHISYNQLAKLIIPNQDILNYQNKEFIYFIKDLKQINTSSKRKDLANLINKEKVNEAFLINAGFSKNYITGQIKAGFLAKEESLKNYEKINFTYQAANFSKAQTTSLNKLRSLTNKQEFSVSFLNGITGSGKTEIYFDLLAPKLAKKDAQILILLPEILLTKQFIDKFFKRFNVKPLLWHSSSSVKEKRQIWHNISINRAMVVVGARSALFLPFKNLQMIILDEEHDSSYKQEETPSYHARDMAIVRSLKEKIPIILVSATPSLETKHNCSLNKYREVKISERFTGSLPNIELIDMRKEILLPNQAISDNLAAKIKAKLALKEQVMLFLNRRGFAPLKICKNCGYRFKCPNCDVFLVSHIEKSILACHHCDYQISDKTPCKKCQEKDNFSLYGFGVERVVEEVKEKFPQAQIVKITSDESKATKNITDIFSKIENNQIDIIIGTQIISKGHHFKKLNLVGVLDGDIGDITDLRYAEKLYQILHQISGRAGRVAGKGEVLIQTYNPELSFYRNLIAGESEIFYAEELAKRKKYNLPPFCKLIALIISAKNKDLAKIHSNILAKLLKENKKYIVLGPAEAPLHFLRNRYRYRILIKSDKHDFNKDIYELVKTKFAGINNLHIKIDIDPLSFS